MWVRTYAPGPGSRLSPDRPRALAGWLRWGATFLRQIRRERGERGPRRVGRDRLAELVLRGIATRCTVLTLPDGEPDAFTAS
jgi:hypothetical protein